jgi:hypothetical protein
MLVSNKDGDKIFIMFPNEEKIALTEIESFSRRMMENQVYRGIMIIRGEISKFALKVI